MTPPDTNTNSKQKDNLMNSSDRLFVTFFSLVALVIITLMILINMNTMHYAQVVENITLETGTNPMYVSCAIDTNRGDNPTCVTLAQGLIKE